MDMSDERRIVILGKTGAGKSSLANTIFGEELFKISHDPNSETGKCQAKDKSVNGRSITLIDTPGFFDTDRSEEELKPEIVSCITECAPGPHAFLIVLKVERYTKHEQEVINTICDNFSEEVFKYATVVFTHGEQLSGQKIEDFVFKNRLISDLVKKCGGRCYVIDNRYWNTNPTDEYRSNQHQVEELLKTIDKMVMKQNKSYYTNEMLQKVEEMKILTEENIRQESGNMTEEEIREEAKSRVYNVLIRLAGVGTGVFIGALLGVAAMVGVVITALQIVPQLNQTLAAIGGAAEAPVIFGAIVGASAAVGAVIGGVEGYHAAEGADTPWEAAKRTAEAVENQTLTVCSKAKDRMSQAKKTYNL
ncbi:GTPase IMAP family member 7-like [Sparus aurata]|uniref:GTPase IMAP family member 7-like n=1 Tax=Sparus aurata TaxID=8175 RepID=UPI0011C0CFEB|nr:GTPase IMAP family member 7-like [Sparus aurata]